MRQVNEDVDQRTLLRKYERELRRLRAELQQRQRELVDKRHLLAVPIPNPDPDTLSSHPNPKPNPKRHLLAVRCRCRQVGVREHPVHSRCRHCRGKEGTFGSLVERTCMSGGQQGSGDCVM